MEKTMSKKIIGGVKEKKKTSFIDDFKKNKSLYIMLIPGIVFFFIFCYIPMGGIVMAFQNFNIMDGIFGSPFNGLENFKFLLSESMLPDLKRVIFNTFFLNVIFIVSGTFAAVSLALVFSEIRNSRIKKITQSVSILPNFISWVIIALFLDIFLNSRTGIITNLLMQFGTKINFYQNPTVWPVVLMILKIWQGAGYGSIVYLATITGIDSEIYEAAEMDGASRWQQILKITLPIMIPTVILLTIFSIGKIFSGDFGMIYALIGDNSQLYSTTDVIDTYVFRMMRTLNEFGLSTAVGLVQSLVGMILVLFSNYLARKFQPESAIF